MKSGRLRPENEGVTCHHIWLVAYLWAINPEQWPEQWQQAPSPPARLLLWVCVEPSQPQILLELEISAIPTWTSIHMSSSIEPSFQHRGGCESYCSLRQCPCCLKNQHYIHTCVLCVHNLQYNFLIPNVCMYSGMLAPPRCRSCTIWPCSGHVSQSWNKRVAFICNIK